MTRWASTNPVNGRRVGSLSVQVLAVLLAGGLAGSAPAQVPVQQNGRLFDRNPQVGSGGYNYARPLSPLIAGNAIASGNVRGGLALRSYSPISAPTSFRASLGSSYLGAFRRDSVSVADSGSPYISPLGTPYYDPSRTVATSGFLSGQYSGAALQVGPLPVLGGRMTMPSGVAGPLDLRLIAGMGVGAGASRRSPNPLEAQITGLTPGVSPELSSTIFGPTPPAVLPSSRVGADLGIGLTQLPQREQRRLDSLGPQDAPLLVEPLGSRPPLGTPLEFVQQGVTQRIPTPEYVDPFAPAGEESAVLVPGPLGVEPPVETVEPVTPAPVPSPSLVRVRDISVLPGYDVFTDMQLARSLELDAGASWWEQMQAAIRESPAAAEMLDEQAKMQSQEFIDQVRNAPITTFHGRGASALNNELLKAESLLEIGRYYEAARRYDAAHHLAPLNPLPLIGKGNALLAAGEYLSAAVALVQGFERYPELTEFTFDLQALMGGGETVDIRRADLLRRLRGHEDPQLRFLLGYLEYYAGDQESGLENFEKAAAADPSGSIISHFPAMLRAEGHLPPPKLSPADAPVPSSPGRPEMRGRDDSRSGAGVRPPTPPKGEEP